MACHIWISNWTIIESWSAHKIQYLEKTLNHEVRVGNEKAKAGWNFYLEAKRRDLKERSDGSDNLSWLQNEKIYLLLKWARVVCAHYGVEIENLSVSFSDGRGLCLLVHHYHPSFLPLNEICMETTQTQQGNSNGGSTTQSSFNDSFDQKVTTTFMTYMAARLLDLSTEMQAARVIQIAWKRFLAARREEELKVRYK